jgi:uncharacterized protein YndB with AHSA1/START domain
MTSKNSIEVSLVIAAPAAQIFSVLSDPQRHKDFDGSAMIKGSLTSEKIGKVGDRFTMQMNRDGDDYLMINIVVAFEQNRLIFWTPAPGDTSRSEGNKEEGIGKPAGYEWGYSLEPISDSTTRVTEVFKFGPLTEKHFQDGGKWINTKNTVEESMAQSLKLLASNC